MPDKKGFDPNVMLKNLTKTITDYGKVMGERSKLTSELLANRMKLSQNWLWKLKEQQASPEYQYQQTLKRQFFKQQGGGVATMAPGTDVFAGQVQPQVRPGTKGYEMHYPTQKEFIYSRIQQKKQKNIPLTEKEIKFEEQYLGVGVKREDPRKELKKYQELAAKEGWFIKVDSTLPIEQQAEEARKLYATRKGLEPDKLSYRDLESRWALEQSYADQIRERAKVLLDDQNLDNSDESVDTFLSNPNNRSLILDEIIGK